jgi:hypothetical protein
VERFASGGANAAAGADTGKHAEAAEAAEAAAAATQEAPAIGAGSLVRMEPEPVADAGQTGAHSYCMGCARVC